MAAGVCGRCAVAGPGKAEPTCALRLQQRGPVLHYRFRASFNEFTLYTFSFDALIFGDVEGPSQIERLRNFATPKDPLDEAARQRVRSAMELAVSVAGDYSGGLDASGKGGAVMDGRWRHWLAVRDAVAPQHPERYSERQIEYHYTKDRGVLLELAASFQSQSRSQSQSHG